jgi:hypothetical protein
VDEELHADSGDMETALPKIDDISIIELLGSKEGALAQALRRLLTNADAVDNYSAHGSSPLP